MRYIVDLHTGVRISHLACLGRQILTLFSSLLSLFPFSLARSRSRSRSRSLSRSLSLSRALSLARSLALSSALYLSRRPALSPPFSRNFFFCVCENIPVSVYIGSAQVNGVVQVKGVFQGLGCASVLSPMFPSSGHMTLPPLLDMVMKRPQRMVFVVRPYRYACNINSVAHSCVYPALGVGQVCIFKDTCIVKDTGQSPKGAKSACATRAATRSPPP